MSGRGGKCLSDAYIDSSVPLKWQCKEGHIWEARSPEMKRGHWCPECAGTKKHTIEDMKKLAIQHNGICLSDIYKGNKVTNVKAKVTD